MNKIKHALQSIKNAFVFLFKNNRAWLITTSVLLIFLLTVSLVLTQNDFLSNSFSTFFGGERRVAISGDPSKYQYYDSSDKDFVYYEAQTPLKNKKDALKEANLFNEQIEEEGIIMLKNNNAMPLKKNAKVSVFGKNANSLVYGGSGSSIKDSKDLPTIYDSLQAAGFEVNSQLRDFYKSGASGKGRGANPGMGDIVYGLTIGETPQASYTAAVKSSYTNYNDAALIVLSRIGGEGFDLPRTMKTSSAANASAVSGAVSADDHYLQLDKNEKALVSAVTSSGTFNKVIIIINCSTAMELGEINDNPKIDGMLWIGSPGGSGINALGKILNGDVNPSGRTVDTYSRDFTQDPTWSNFGNNLTEGGNQYTVGEAGKNAYFVEYEEGIYVGYRYYETRGYTDGEQWYNDNVVYPFGYGLSYSEFDWKIKSFEPSNFLLQKDGTVTVNVEVTNRTTSKFAGQDVVQLYYSAQYYDGEVEKSHVVLGDFAKTKLLNPGETDTVQLNLKVSEMASYDYSSLNPNGHTGYELDSGDYMIYIGRNAHEAWNSQDTDRELYFLAQEDILYDVDSATEKEVKNRFDDVSSHIKTYLSRENWDFSMPKAPTALEREVDAAFVSSLDWKQDDSGKIYETTVMPTQGVKSTTNPKLYQLIKSTSDGKITVDYDDPLWEDLLNTLTVEEMAYLIGTGNYNTAQLASIDKPKTTDPDGPAGFTNFLGNPDVYETCFYASECVIGATFNKGLAHDMGVMIGLEGLFGNEKGDGRTYSGWYAPAANIHRSPFSGRNWEYYSEDGLFSGIMAANVVSGAKSKGVYTYVKHFALNDQETNRDTNGIVTWANEQSMREIYLKPFELAVKDGGTTAMMSSFNRIGTVWAGGSYELLTEVLRNEWGFKGMVITDYNLSDYMITDEMIRAGGDLNLTQVKFPTTKNASATQISLIRAATKNILYTVAQSNAMNGSGDGVKWGYAMPYWTIILIIIDCVSLAALAAWGFFSIRKSYKRKNKSQT